MRKGELKVFFRMPEGVNREVFERELEHFLLRHGFKRWASGMEIQTQIRDIAFDAYPHLPKSRVPLRRAFTGRAEAA